MPIEPLTQIPANFGTGGSGLTPNGSTGSPSLRSLLAEHVTALETLDTEASAAASAASASAFKPPVRVATAAALAAYTRTGNVITANANGALAAVDGVTLAAGERLLLKNGAAGADNGIYVVTQLGSGGTPFILTRATDMDVSAEAQPGSVVNVNEGTVYADHVFKLTTNAAITLNTTSLTFARQTPFRGQGTLVAGTFDVTGIDLAASSRIYLTLAARPTVTNNIAGLAVVSRTTGLPATGAFTVEAILTTTAIDSDAAGTVDWLVWD